MHQYLHVFRVSRKSVLDWIVPESIKSTFQWVYRRGWYWVLIVGKVIIIQVGSIRKCAPALPSNFVNKQSVCASKVDFKKLYLLSDLYVCIEQAVHCFLKSALSLGDNLAGSWDISRNLPISWTRNWDKLIFSVHFQNLDRESESSNISRDRAEHTDYLGPSQQGENCFLNQPGFNKPWECFEILKQKIAIMRL